MFELNKYLIFTPHTLTSSSQNGDCQNQLADMKDKFIRVSADFENYKRRMQKEQTQWFDLGQSKVLTQLLNIVDDFDRALRHSSQPSHKASADVAGQALLSGNTDEGFKLIYKSLQKLLDSFDVKEISPDLPFDPEMHEALLSVEESGKQAGEVVEILQKGYLYKGKVLRPAKVSVAK